MPLCSFLSTMIGNLMEFPLTCPRSTPCKVRECVNRPKHSRKSESKSKRRCIPAFFLFTHTDKSNPSPNVHMASCRNRTVGCKCSPFRSRADTQWCGLRLKKNKQGNTTTVSAFDQMERSVVAASAHFHVRTFWDRSSWKY